MKDWQNLVSRRRVDAAAAAVQWFCLLVVVAVELLFFLPGEAADGIVYLFLEWRLVDVSILFLAASFCRKSLRESRWYFFGAVLMVLWFYLVRGLHLRLEGTSQVPGTFVCAWLLCLPFAAASADKVNCWGLKALSAVFFVNGTVFGGYALLLVLGRLPAALDGIVFWDGPRFATMGHPNICAAVLMISIGLWAITALSVKQTWLKGLSVLMIVFQFCVMSLTNSRTTIVLTCVLLGGIIFCAMRKPGWKGTLTALAAAIALMVLLFCCSRWLFAWNSDRLTRMAQLTGETSGLTLNAEGQLVTENGQGSFVSSLRTLNGRTEIWAGAVQALRDNPGILLTGTERAGEIISPYWTHMDVLHTHNAWVQTLFQLGIPGLLAAVAVTVLALWDIAVLLWYNNDLMHSSIALMVLCLMGCAMLEPYLFTAYPQFHFFDFFFLLCLGYLDQWRREEGRRQKPC